MSNLVPALGSAAVHAYSDIEIHHMGTGLADNVSQGNAGGDQFRTAPLWGLGQRIFLLHDGRTTNLIAAIRHIKATAVKPTRWCRPSSITLAPPSSNRYWTSCVRCSLFATAGGNGSYPASPLRFSKGFMRFIYSVVLAWGLSLSAAAQDAGQQAVPKSGGDFSNSSVPLVKVPEGVILVKGAWASASDSVTPVPEGASVDKEAFSAPYFGMTYQLPSGWTQKYQGPPPSETGRYVLAQLSPAAASNGTARGSISIAAQDMFFTPLPAHNTAELIRYMSAHLQADYQPEIPPAAARIAGRDFTVFAYWSPVAEIHWYVLATEIRCHTVQFVLTSRDTKLLEALIRSIDKMTPPAEANPSGGAVPSV